MEKSCYEYQQQIAKQLTASNVLDQQIDFHQEQTVTLLKTAIIRKHFYIQRMYMTERYIKGQVAEPLQHSSFITKESEVAANFAELDLPDDFSKGPMKAFLNTLLDSLENFLPAFYKLIPSKLPRTNASSFPSETLLKTVFPSLFGYCWASEAALAYATNLATWFGELYKENPSFLENFENHWMYQAMQGFFNSLDFQSFVTAAIRPIFVRFIQIETEEQQTDPQTLLDFASSLIYSMHANFHKLPAILNDLFSELFSKLQNDDEKQLIVRYLFFDLFLSYHCTQPILSGTSDVALPSIDYKNFELVYQVFQVKFGTAPQEFSEKISSLVNYQVLDTSLVFDDIMNRRASLQLPSLQSFCEVVQCAHQPLLMTTYSVSLLFRFVASLQHTAMLPKSIDRSIDTVFQQALTDQLEVLPERLFWFPCFSLTYLKIQPTHFASASKTSPLYRLLSLPSLRISPTDMEVEKALDNAFKAVNLATNPEIRTEITWIKETTTDFTKIFDDLKHEIASKENEIDEKKQRASKLNNYSIILKDQLKSIPFQASKIALALYMLPKFIEKNNDFDIQSSAFINQACSKIYDFCGSSFPGFGTYLAHAILVEITPTAKRANLSRHLSDFAMSIQNLDEIQMLRKSIEKPIYASSIFSIACKLTRDLVFLQEYASLNNIPNIFSKVFAPPFYNNSKLLSGYLSNFINNLPMDIIKLVFHPKEIQALNVFIQEIQ